jgi:hypothetical protein
MVFLGYAEGTKGYRMYDPVSKKLHITRDVIFEENKGWDWCSTSDDQNRPEFLITEFQRTVAQPATGQMQENQQPEVPDPASPSSAQMFPVFGSPRSQRHTTQVGLTQVESNWQHHLESNLLIQKKKQHRDSELCPTCMTQQKKYRIMSTVGCVYWLQMNLPV